MFEGRESKERGGPVIRFNTPFRFRFKLKNSGQFRATATVASEENEGYMVQ